MESDFMSFKKRVAAIHDISGFGKCSLTVALPIISAAGVEVSVMPTAVLSTHTGGIEGFTYRDLTEDLMPFAKHWKSLDIKFDAIYSGFLGSYEQIDIVSKIFDILKNEDTIIIVDPCMADNGSLYKIYTDNMVGGMAKLCSKADIIIPNITEAVMILNREYKEGPYNREYIESLLKDLSGLGCKKVVLTGVYFNDEVLGSASYDSISGEVNYSFAPRIEGSYHGTGDVFGSAFVASLMNGFSLAESSRTAVNYTQRSISRTAKLGTDRRFGVDFEPETPYLLKRLNMLNFGEK